MGIDHFSINHPVCKFVSACQLVLLLDWAIVRFRPSFSASFDGGKALEKIWGFLLPNWASALLQHPKGSSQMVAPSVMIVGKRDSGCFKVSGALSGCPDNFGSVHYAPVHRMRPPLCGVSTVPCRLASWGSHVDLECRSRIIIVPWILGSSSQLPLCGHLFSSERTIFHIFFRFLTSKLHI